MAEVDEIEIRNGTHKDDQYSGASEDTNIGTPESNNGEQQDNQDAKVKGVSMETYLPKSLSPSQDSENKDEDAKVTGKTACRKLSLSNRENNVDGDKPTRKRKWRTVSNNSQSVKKTSLNISTDSLKELIPDIKTLSTLDSVLELDEEEAQISDNDFNLKEEFHEINKRDVKIRRTVTQVVREIEHQDSTQDGMDLDQGELLEKSQQIPVLKKSRISQPTTLIEEPLVVRGIPSPARNPISRIIHIRNLVRPFTLAQLKNLLSRTGTLVSGFWIDKIKSHCYATYESDDQAIATRQALHGVKWPPPNPKYLKVDYADQEELDFHKNLIEKDLKPAELIKKERRDNDHGGREIRTDFDTRMPEREWDRDKVLHQSSSADKTHTRSRTRSGSQEKWKPEKATAKERREKKEREKKDDEAPAKLLDDLFNKTKATPCIYWLALTEEQMKAKLEEKKQMLLEREKRRQLLEKEQKKRIEAERKERREADERRQQRRERNDRSKVTGRSPTRRSRSRNRNSRSRRR